MNEEGMNALARFLKRIPMNIAIGLITFYRWIISPLLPSCCRFVPTCSEYGIMAFKRFGFFRGFILTAKRIGRCRPGGPHGYDPVHDAYPVKKKEELG